MNFQEAHEKGFLVTLQNGSLAENTFLSAYFYDVFNPAARKFLAANMRETFVNKYGITNWWLDDNEPIVHGRGKGSAHSTRQTRFVYNNGTWPSELVAAAYPYLFSQALVDGLEQDAPQVRLGRAAWAGDQRLGSAVWSGDTTSTWEVFEGQFRAGLNMQMSGIVYWTTDIGGYARRNTLSPSFRELVTRWFQWGKDLDACPGRSNPPSLDHHSGTMRRLTRSRDCLRRTLSRAGAFCPLFRLHGQCSGPLWPPAAGVAVDTAGGGAGCIGYLVSGAGSADANGCYAGNNSVFSKDTTHTIYAYKSRWHLGHQGVSVEYSTIGESSSPPDSSR